MNKIQLSDIILDETIYPRENIDQKRVGIFAENIRDGFTFDPIKVQPHPEKEGKYHLECIGLESLRAGLPSDLERPERQFVTVCPKCRNQHYGQKPIYRKDLPFPRLPKSTPGRRNYSFYSRQSPLQGCRPFFSRHCSDDDSKRYYENFITFVRLIEISQLKSGDGTGLLFC